MHNLSMLNSSLFARRFASSSIQVLRSTCLEPFFNLAVEDWLLNSESPRHVLFLWRNEPTVVVGKNQNPWKECDLQKMDKDGVHLARRRSGGGAVYQDLGNTNFTLVSPIKQFDKQSNFSDIITALASFGIAAKQSGRNDVLVGSRKVSGSAFKLTKRVALHHGTLLLDVNLNAMGKYLHPNKLKLLSKGVSSVQARVMNLKEAASSITHETVSDTIISSFCRRHNVPNVEVEQFGQAEMESIPDVRSFRDELKNWKWRFGETPHFSNEHENRFEWGTVDVNVDVVDGTIKSCRIFSDSLFPTMIETLENALVDHIYTKSGVDTAVDGIVKDTDEWSPYVNEFRTWLRDVV